VAAENFGFVNSGLVNSGFVNLVESYADSFDRPVGFAMRNLKQFVGGRIGASLVGFVGLEFASLSFAS